MKTGIVCLLVSATAFGQFARPSRPLGGIAGSAPVTGRPLGGVALPQFPGFPGPIARNPPTYHYGNHRYGSSGYGYVGPVYYIPNAFDYSFDTYQAPAPGANQSSYLPQYQPQTQPPPIIVNQYFGMPAPAGGRDAQLQAPLPPDPAQTSAKPGDLLSEPENYYLIEYKDHTIYPALTYWLEGDTLHYVTTQNTHNQVSLSLVDLDKTAKLNQDRSIPFTIPGK
ncbi:MAG: hypothetical protein KGN84_11295 [Acidobacteriota bacterium]|nr:hypothetical protein [Acidobacteriota bacterium]